MTEQKNSSEKTEKTDKSDKASAPKKHTIEPKSARGASTTARRKTAKEADDALQDKIEKARAGAMPERREPAAAGESAGLPPVQTVRAMPQINRKKDETTSDEKAVAKKPSAPVKMPERDATGRGGVAPRQRARARMLVSDSCLLRGCGNVDERSERSRPGAYRGGRLRPSICRVRP